MLLRAEAVSKSFGLKDVLKSASIQINKGDRFGLIGKNGTGKTTLLKLFMGQIKPDTGEIILKTDRIGYQSQSPDLDSTNTVNDVLGKPYGSHATLTKRIAELEELMQSGSPNEEYDLNEITIEYSKLLEEFGSTGGHALSSKAKNALVKVGLGKEISDRIISKISGGELTKVMLARVLIQAEKADILFLDEPTSHLDLKTINWLEHYLKKINAGIVIVSHDRYFLDNVVTQIIELDNGILNHYSGNYSEFVEKKSMEKERDKKTYNKYQYEKNRHKKIIEKQYSRLTYGTTHKTRMKMLDRVKVVDKPKKEKDFHVKIEAVKKSGKNMIMANSLVVERGEIEILSGVDLDLEIGDKLGIFGPNGSGKTTLLKTILNEIPYKGDLWVAPGANIGYFTQAHDQLDQSMTPEQTLSTVFGNNEKLKVRNLLARFMLIGRDVIRPISTLSGGERARVALALLIAKQHNLLIMDEPTNYLDIPARHAVESALAEYPGTLLIITHDRYFLDSVCNKVGELKDGKLTVYSCTYSELKGRKVDIETNNYKVISGFKNWKTKKKYSAGDEIIIANNELEYFKWALENGLLKKKKIV